MAAEWFREWFGEEYLALYPHRDDEDAARLVERLVRTLPWAAGWRVLDIGCGPGRHARALDAAGARCIGLDLSMVLLRRARSATRAALVRADMRHLPIRPRTMDLTVNLFTSFGYFTHDAEHRDALRAMVATVRAGGWFALDYLNATTVREHLAERDLVPVAQGAARVSRRLSGDGRYVAKTILTGDGRAFEERVRLFAPAELEVLLRDAGLTVRHRFGDYDGGPLADGSPRALFLGQVA